jgi:hypothetical protein
LTGPLTGELGADPDDPDPVDPDPDDPDPVEPDVPPPFWPEDGQATNRMNNPDMQ